MTTTGFTVSHLRDVRFEPGRHSFFECRDRGVAQATGGGVVAQVIRGRSGAPVSGQPHRHHEIGHGEGAELPGSRCRRTSPPNACRRSDRAGIA